MRKALRIDAFGEYGETRWSNEGGDEAGDNIVKLEAEIGEAGEVHIRTTYEDGEIVEETLVRVEVHIVWAEPLGISVCQ